MALSRWVVVGLTALALAACGTAPPGANDAVTDDPEVIAGQTTRDFPAVGYLAIGDDAPSLEGPICGATLIRPNVAVTAAHCVVATKPTTKTSRFGVGFGRRGGKIHLASKVFVHPQYQPAFDAPNRHRHDIAVLILESTPTVAPAGRGTAPEVGEGLRYVGYGRSTPGTANMPFLSGTRKMAGMKVVSSDAEGITVEGIDGGLCWGDSGGPLLRGYGVVGVLADFADQKYVCAVGNRMIFTSLESEAAFLDAAITCAGDEACALRQNAELRGADGSCRFPCSTNKTTEGQCVNGWACREGCLEPSNACPTCERTCAEYRYAEGQCGLGWRCTQGCIVMDGACGSTCEQPCSRLGYREGQCLNGFACKDGCVVRDASCPAPVCQYACKEFEYAEGECRDGWTCSNGCLRYTKCSNR